MKRFWGHAIAAVGFLVSATELFPACVHNDSSLFIQGVLAPAAAGAANGAQCTVTADPSQLHLSSGLLDVAFRRAYSAEILIGNQLASRVSAEQGRTETNRVVIQGAIVTVTDAAGNSLHPAYTKSAAGMVDPSTGTTPGYAAIGVQLVDHSVLDAIADAVTSTGTPTRVLIHVKVFGNTLGGEHVESNDYQFPLDICYACLVQFPAAAISPVSGRCTGSGGSGGSSFAPCVLGQDQSFPCSVCPDLPVCIPSGAIVTPDAGASDAPTGG